MVTRYERILETLPRTELRNVNGEKLAYIDEGGTIRMGIFGITTKDFKVFAAWVADLARDEVVCKPDSGGGKDRWTVRVADPFAPSVIVEGFGSGEDSGEDPEGGGSGI